MHTHTPSNHHTNHSAPPQSLAAARDQLGAGRAVPMLLGPITFLWLGHLRPSLSSQVQQKFGMCMYVCVGFGLAPFRRTPVRCRLPSPQKL